VKPAEQRAEGVRVAQLLVADLADVDALLAGGVADLAAHV